MIGCVEFTFNASFFFVWCGAFFYLVWRRLSWYALFLNLYKVSVASLLNLGNISGSSSYIIDFQAIGISKKH